MTIFVYICLTYKEQELYKGGKYYENLYSLFYEMGIGLAAAGGTLTVVSVPLLAGEYHAT